jgi:cyclopropane-fatty-acyl-phospholipid synthase
VLKNSAEAAALAVVEQLDFGGSYALTLKEWRRRFLENWAEIAPLGFDEPFRRLWEFYLCYCEAGFRARTIDVKLLALEGR